jgi:hypothetical protein
VQPALARACHGALAGAIFRSHPQLRAPAELVFAVLRPVA